VIHANSLPPHRYLAVWLPLLSSERIRTHHHGLPERAPESPFALVEKVKGAMRIAALDEAALALGLAPGMTLADARAAVPDLAAVEHDASADSALLHWLAESCGRYTPSVMADPPGGLILDITGCTHFFADDARQLAKDLHARLARIGFTARLALAETPEAAAALARFGSSGIMGGGDVGALPVTALRVNPDVHTALRRAGLKTIGAVAIRPRAALAARFGRALPDLLDRLLGLADTHITPYVVPEEVTAEARFAEPIARTDDALEIVARLVGEAAVELGRRGVGGRRFVIALYRSDGHVARVAIETGAPTRDPVRVVRLLRERIDALSDPLDPGFGYDLIRLAIPFAEPLSPAQLQLEGGTLADGEFAALVDRLVARLGRGRVRRFANAGTHIPEQASFTLPATTAPPLALATFALAPPLPGEPPLRPLHLFDPPQRIDVLAQVPDGPPHRFRWRRSLHEVSRYEGPERIAAEWWRRRNGPGLTRDYYRVEDAAGRRFWVFRHGLYGAESADPRWYLHGLFA
jgi:protein ImuB